MTKPVIELDNVEACVDEALNVLGNTIRIAAPLGLGKPNQLLNAFYRRACADPSITLEIMTALSLERPRASSDLEARFLDPFVERLFGDYEALDYVKAQRDGSLPGNISVSEFYIKAGSMKNVLSVQCNYISTNYTFAARDILNRGANLLVQLVSERDGYLSLSCNTDVTLDLLPMMRARAMHDGKPVLAMAQVHSDLPFMVHKAARRLDEFDVVVRNDQYNTTLFSTPNMPVSTQDYALGMLASTVVKDGGTLQIGIGALGDAITYACLLRHENNRDYLELLDGVLDGRSSIDAATEVFEQGLYGCSEMFVYGFYRLMKAGVLNRRVYDNLALQKAINAGSVSERLSADSVTQLKQAGVISDPPSDNDQTLLSLLGLSDEHNRPERMQSGIAMHGGFFLGPKAFYQALRDLDDEQRELIAMDSVREINRLSNPALQAAQRRDARFINTAMMVTLSGAIVSDGLENGQVISGVGGQYNFVAQAHELDDARSVICVRACRGQGKNRQSNIVYNYGHTTVPRHLRDIVITEYGIADLRGKTDAQVAAALLNVCDSQFQQAMLARAVSEGKLPADFEIPAQYCSNTPEYLDQWMRQAKSQGLCPDFPLGSDFTEEELALQKTLSELNRQTKDPLAAVSATIKALLTDSDEEAAKPYLERIGLDHPESTREHVLQQLLLLELEHQGYLRPL